MPPAEAVSKTWQQTKSERTRTAILDAAIACLYRYGYFNTTTESIAREAGPKGIHAAYVAIDAVIDLEWTRSVFKDKPDEFFCQPADIAAEVYRIAHQPRSAWSFESVIRPFGEYW